MIGLNIDYKDVSISLKTLVGTLLVSAPVWYFDIAIFSNSFYGSQPFYITILAAYCLTIAWGIINSLSVALSEDPVQSRKKDESEEEIAVVSVIFGLAIQLPITLYAYLHHWNFLKLLTYCYIYAGSFLILCFCSRFLIKRTSKPVDPKV